MIDKVNFNSFTIPIIINLKMVLKNSCRMVSYDFYNIYCVYDQIYDYFRHNIL